MWLMILFFLGLIVPIALFTWWMKRTTGYDVRDVEGDRIGRYMGRYHWKRLTEYTSGEAEKARAERPQTVMIDPSRLRDGTDEVDGEVAYYEVVEAVQER